MTSLAVLVMKAMNDDELPMETVSADEVACGDAHQSASTIPPDAPQIAGLDEPDHLNVDYDLNFSICAIKKRATKVRGKFQVAVVKMSAR